MTDAASSGRRSGTVYLALLSFVLLGYAMLGKGFAYLGIPPIHIGEIALLAGVLVFWRTRCFGAVLTTAPALLLAATMGWVLLRTLPFIEIYGFDALRDSVIVMYGGFAFTVAALVLEDCRRLNKIVQYYHKFLNIYLLAIPLLFVISWFKGDYLPKMPGTDLPFVLIEPGEVAAHFVGATVFVLVGLGKLSRFRLVLLVASAVIVGTLSRGPMLAEVVPIVFAAVILGKWRQLVLTFLAGIMLFAVAYAIEPFFFDYAEARSSVERTISTRQVIDNVLSTVGQGADQSEGTKEWRLQWWNMIISNTVFGPNFWTGRGFGLNIALADGFSRASFWPPVRSPHNVQMTMLARAGVPGLTLWLGLIISWFGMVLHAERTARRRGKAGWAGVFLVTTCYVGSILINATFDPALEAPMQGVWFWSLIGLGIGSVMVYRFQHEASHTATRLARP
jgi:hypothetical protein